jgi:GGDEF domain-containing protein
VKKTLETIGLPKLTPQQKENLLILAEKAARNHIQSKIPPQKITTLNIIVEIEGEKPVTVTVDIELTLTPQTKNHNTKQLANEATKKALQATDKYLKETACKSNK